MKNYLKIILYICFIIGIKISIQAQTDEKTSRELYQDYLENIDIDNLNTSFLLNKGFINEDEILSLYQFIETYDEETTQIIPPISQMDAISWVQTYSHLLESEISLSKKLPSIEEVNTQLENNSSSSNIPILIFDAKGELLEDTEIENSIENLSKKAPYNEIHLFGAMGSINKSYTKTVNFELNSENYFSGFTKKESTIFIDFANGNGIQEYSSSQGVVSINYADLGEKLITIYRDAILNGVSMKIGSSFILDIKADNTGVSTTVLESNTTDPLAGSSDVESNSVISSKGASAYIDLGNDNVFDKPIIIIQGFDPVGDITVDTQREKYSSFEPGLSSDGYDIVYIMFSNTNLSLQTNTNVVKDLIQQINSLKERNFESIIIGESMGGLISRMALKQFENENYDHKVGLYVSFDAPHQGANLPPGLQYLFKDVLESRTVSGISAILGLIDNTAISLANLLISPFTGDRIPNLTDALQINMAYEALTALNSTAAKSMIVRHINSDDSFNSSQNVLSSLGYPSNSRNIALINGSNQNTDLQTNIDGTTFIPGGELIDFPLWKSDCNEFSLKAWSSSINTKARVSQIKWKIGLKVPEVIIKWENTCILRGFFGKCLLSTKLPVRVTVGTTCATTNLINKEKYYNFNRASYDNAPGSTLPGLNDLPFDITANTTFVPTASAIDLSDNAYNSSTDPDGLRAITNSTVLDGFITNNQTPFDEIYSKTYNTSHVFFNSNDFTNFRSIITDEFMFENLDMQNKTITNDRDFEADDIISIGNNINSRTAKNYVSGDVIIKDDATVNFTAKNGIILHSGTHFESGTNVSLVVNNTSSKSLNSNILTDYFQIKIIGSKEYTIGKSPSFKVLSSDVESEYDYNWELTENTQITSNSEEFIIDEFLYPGLYTLKVEVTSRTSFKTETLTKIFKVNTDLNIDDQNDIFDLTGTSSTINVYPNPVVDNVTVIAQKDISEIIIYDLSSKIILKTEDINKTWQSFDLTKLSSGTYILDIHFMDGSISSNKKLIKQ